MSNKREINEENKYKPFNKHIKMTYYNKIQEEQNSIVKETLKFNISKNSDNLNNDLLLNHSETAANQKFEPGKTADEMVDDTGSKDKENQNNSTDNEDYPSIIKETQHESEKNISNQELEEDYEKNDDRDKESYHVKYHHAMEKLYLIYKGIKG